MAEDSSVGGWSTIESDEAVFTSLVEQLGVKGVQFDEVHVLEERAIRPLSPVYGVVFLFRYLSTTSITNATPQDGSFSDSAVDQDGLFFAAQTIQNACGTQAALSVILNNDSSNPSLDPEIAIDVGDELRTFKDFTTGFTTSLRGEALSNSSLIRETHNSFARSSPFADETLRDPSAEREEAFHYIGYTVRNNTLYELDGLQPHPISHGACSSEEFPQKIVPILQRRIYRYPITEVRFNLTAVRRDPRIRAAEIGDHEVLKRERAKRATWDWDNALRKCNFVGFVGEVLKGVAGMKLERGQYDEWLAAAKQEADRRIRMRIKRAQIILDEREYRDSKIP